MTKLNKRKVFKRAIFGILFAITMFIAVISYSAVNPPKSNMEQLSRIDFPKPISQEDADVIYSIISKIPHIKSKRINKEQGTLVYTYNVEDQSSSEVIKVFESYNNNALQAKAYIVSKEECETGCPMSVANTSLFAKILKKTVSLF